MIISSTESVVRSEPSAFGHGLPIFILSGFKRFSTAFYFFLKLDSILKSTDIDLIPPTEFDDFFIRRIVEQVTILSNEKIEVRFIGGFSKVGDIPKNEK